MFNFNITLIFWITVSACMLQVGRDVSLTFSGCLLEQKRTPSEIRLLRAGRRFQTLHVKVGSLRKPWWLSWLILLLSPQSGGPAEILQGIRCLHRDRTLLAGQPSIEATPRTSHVRPAYTDRLETIGSSQETHDWRETIHLIISCFILERKLFPVCCRLLTITVRPA